ncbi:MAG: aromatic ring-hydroxylating dioxygenase subunit alpha [Rhodospirillales bacterium]
MNQMSRAFDQDLSDVLAPTESAKGMPNAFYTDPSMYDVERGRVFDKTWVAIGFGKDVPDAGDVVPVEIMGTPLILLRDKAGAVHVYHNVCSHRGMRLVEEPAKGKTVLACPYHAWCYGLDGALRGTPSIGGPGVNELDGFDRKEHGLKEVRSAVWMDTVFVNLSGDAEPFEVRVRPINERWKDFVGRPLFHGGEESSSELEVACNWKLAVENYCESYHLPWVHPGLNTYSRLEDHYHLRDTDGAQYAGQGTLVYRPIEDQDGRVFPYLSGIDSKWSTAAEYVAMFPNVLYGAHRDHWFAMLLEPHGHNRTRERVEIWYFDEASLGDEYETLRRNNAQQWRVVFQEDIFAVEGMQRGRASPGFRGGVFSSVMDGPTHDFHRWVARKVMAGD